MHRDEKPKSARRELDARDAGTASDADRGPSGPLDGNVTGTIGGGGPESGGHARRQRAPEFPPVKPENAASGRREPDPIAAGVERERMQPVPSAADRRPEPRTTKKRSR